MPLLMLKLVPQLPLNYCNTKFYKMNKIISLFVFFVAMSVLSAFAQDDGNGGGAVCISFGNEYVEPVSLSGDDPSIPPKPKKEFHTNSIILNQILAACDDFSALQTLLQKLQNASKITLLTMPEDGNCFVIVNKVDTKEVVAVLDRGKGKRMNLLNNQFETEEIYEGETFKKRYFLLLE